MTEQKINRVHRFMVKNYQGVNHVEIIFNDDENIAKIKGENGLGKSSIFDAEAMEKESANLTEQIKGIDAKKADMIASANIPVKGLTFDQSGVFYKGIPLEQVNTAKKLEIGVELCASTDSNIKMCLIRDGSNCDHRTEALLERICEKYNMQCLIERAIYKWSKDEKENEGKIVITMA